MENKKGVLLMVFLLSPLLMLAGGIGDEEYAKAVQFLQGDGILEEYFVDGFIANLQSYGAEHYSKYVLFAQAVGGITGLIYLSNKAWEFLSGDKQWDVMPLLRPLVFALIIANWSPLVTFVQLPFQAISDTAKDEFMLMQNDLLGQRVARFKIQNQLTDGIIEMKTETAMAQDAIDSENEEGGMFGWVPSVGGAIDDMAAYIMGMGLKLQFNLQLVFSNFLEIIGLLLLRLVAYGMLFIQQIMIIFLIVIGPIAFGFSILPTFRNSWVSWFSKFIGVQFYSVITYVIMQMGIMLQLTAIEGELTRYRALVDETTGEITNVELVSIFIDSGVMTFGMLLLAYILTAVGLLMVPTLSSYVLGSASSTSAVTSKGGALAGMAVGKMM